MGYLMYLPDGHMSAVLTSEGRKSVPPSDEKQVAQLFQHDCVRGTYTVDDDRVVHHVEVAWLPSWVGSDQPQQANLEGDTLTIRTQPMRMMARTTSIFWCGNERVDDEVFSRNRPS